MKKHLIIIAILGILILLIRWDFSSEIEYDNKLPVLHIYSRYNEEFFVDRERRIDSVLTLSNVSDDIQFSNIDASVRGRGNSTWNIGTDKRPLRFRFDEAKSIFDSNYESTDWILLANHFDRSLLRNHGALYLSLMLEGLAFTPTSHFLHLYVNGEYMGVYQLTEERINPDLLGLTYETDPAKSGYLIELNMRAYNNESRYLRYFRAGLERIYRIRYPDDDDLTREHTRYAQNFINHVSDAILSQDFDEIQRWIDIPSFIDFFIVNELFKETDSFQESMLMQIRGQGHERRLYRGPVWDFDLSSGNSARSLGELLSYTGYPHNLAELTLTHPYLDFHPEGLFTGLYNYWYYHLLDVPEFRMLLISRWNEIKDNEISQMIDEIERIASTYQADFERNFNRHRVLGDNMWRSPAEVDGIRTHRGQVEYLVDWLETRVEWLDNYFNEN